MDGWTWIKHGEWTWPAATPHDLLQDNVSAYRVASLSIAQASPLTRTVKMGRSYWDELE